MKLVKEKISAVMANFEPDQRFPFLYELMTNNFTTLQSKK